MRTKEGELLANPPYDRTIDDGDRLIIIGTRKKLAKLEKAYEEGESHP